MQGDGAVDPASTGADDCEESGSSWLLGSEELRSKTSVGWSRRLGMAAWF